MSKPLSDLLTSQGLRLIQYGRAGAGKTTRAASAARWGVLELHDFDDKAQNLALFLKKNNPDLLEKIRVVSYQRDESGKPLTDIQRAERFIRRIKELRNGKPDITTLVLDSLTRFEECYLNFLMACIPATAASFGSPRSTSKVAGEDFVSMGTSDYSILTSGIKKLMGWVKELPINFILNAHIRDTIETKKEIVDEGTLAARGQVREFLPTEFTEFHRLFVDTYSKNRVQVRPSAQYLAFTALTDVPSNGIMLDNTLAPFDVIAFKGA